MRPIMVSLCDASGVMAAPWAEVGVECYCVDLEHSIRAPRREGFVNYVWGDARSWCPPDGSRIVLLAAFPPCTHLAGSGARDWVLKGHYLLTDALELWTACMMAAAYSGAPYMVENPVGALSRHMRDANAIIEPWQYAGWADDPDSEAYTKQTHLWTGNGFRMPEKKRVQPALGSKMWSLTPSDDRAAIRSQTPQGFARAVFAANSHVLSKHLEAAE